MSSLKGYITQNTGMSGSDYLYSKDYYSTLTEYKLMDLDGYCVLRLNPSKNGFNTGEVHVNRPYAFLENADLVCFEDETYPNPYICRIKSIEYVNKNTTRLQFEVDFLMTFYKNIKFGYCYVERHHPFSDAPGEHLISEPISVPTYMSESSATDINNLMKALYGDYCYNILMSTDMTGNGNGPDVKLSTYCGAPYYGAVYQKDSGQEVVELLKSTLDRVSVFDQVNPTANNILHIFLAPRNLYKQDSDMISTDGILNFNLPPSNWSKTLSPQFTQFRLICKSNGSSIALPIQNAIQIEEGTITFEFVALGCGGNSPQTGIAFKLKQNEEAPSEAQENKALLLMNNPFPELPCGFFIHANRSIWEQTEKSISTVMTGGGIVGGIVAGIGATLAAPEVLAVSGVALLGASIASSLAERNKFDTAQIGNMHISTVTPTDCFNISDKRYEFAVNCTSPTNEGLNILNDFFHYFGYQLDRVLIPRPDLNPNFTYIKTREGIQNIGEAIPIYAQNAINNVFNSGIRFWKVAIGSTGRAK